MTRNQARGAKALLSAIVLASLAACGGGGSSATPVADTPVTILSAKISLDAAPGNGASAGSGVTPPNPVARNAALSNTYTKSGNPGAVSAIVSGGACDGFPFSFATTVVDTATGGTVSHAHPNVLFPAGGECAYTVKVQGAVANSDGSFPSDSKPYSYVVDSSAADRVVVLSASQNDSPVVYVRQDDGSHRLHVPKKDFTWTPGNCLLQRVPTSATIRAAACKKIGEPDAAYYVVALSAADWTLSQSATQIAKLGAVAVTTDMVYWAGANDLVAKPTPQLTVSVNSKGGTYTRGDESTVSFTPTGSALVLVESYAKLGSIKLFLAW